MKKLTLSVLGFTLLIILALTGPLSAAPRYYYQDLGVLPGGNWSYAYGLNHAGQVVGEANLNPSGGATHAFLKTPGQPIQDLGGFGNAANGINRAGQVVGNGGLNGFMRAFLKDPGQPMQDLGALEGGNVSYAYGINDAGQVVGKSDYVKSGEVSGTRAFLKNPGQPMQNLGTLGGWYSEALAINNAGQVAGTSNLTPTPASYARAFLKNPGQAMQDLGILPGASSSFAFGLNNAGQVVGYVYDAHPFRAFLKNPGQNMQDLDTLGGACSWAYGINDAGQIVGWADDTAIHSQKAFLWEKGVMYNLNHLTVNLPGTGEWPSVYLATATAINDRGWIVGFTGQGYSSPHAFLLVPVTSNAAMDLLLLD